MPDASDPRGRAPLGWGDAFAALPPEAPPADAWSRLSARLDARGATTAAAPDAAPDAHQRRDRHRRSRGRGVHAAGWLGAATAAALALVVVWPRHDAPQDASHAPAQAAAPLVASRTAPPDASDAVPAAAIALPKVAEAARKPRLARRGLPVRGKASPPTPSAATPAAGDVRLDALYAESARLEALLVLARDDRVASAGAALLASELDLQVAGIDARLAQPGLDAAQRASLWQARVDALRQAAGFESTQRVLASQGDAGALLVSVD